MESDAIGKHYVGMDSSILMEMAHSKTTTHDQKVAAVSDQFESVLVKQFLKEALKPMFKGVLMRMVHTKCAGIFLLTLFPKVLPGWGVWCVNHSSTTITNQTRTRKS